MKPKLLSVRDAAKYVGVSPRTVYRLIADERLTAITIRKKRMINLSEIVGVPVTSPYQVTKHVSTKELDGLVFDLPRRKACGMRDSKGRWASKREWPKLAEKAKRDPIQALCEDGIDLSHLG